MEKKSVSTVDICVQLELDVKIHTYCHGYIVFLRYFTYGSSYHAIPRWSVDGHCFNFWLTLSPPLSSL